MSILLPQPRGPKSATIRLVDYGVDLTPPGGGPAQRLDWPGTRFALVLTFTRLRPEPDARVLGAALRRAKQEGALYPVPQPGLDIGNPGAPVVDGNGQQGSTLTCRGFAPGYGFRDGQFFSIIYGGQRYLHHVAEDIGADGDGRSSFTIFPMLRISPNDGATVEFAQPMIEGRIAGSAVDIELAAAKATPATITITERS